MPSILLTSAILLSVVLLNAETVIAARLTSGRCMVEADLSSEVTKLSFAGAYEEQEKIKNLLIRQGRRSSSCRTRVISVLMRAMDKPNPGLYVWLFGAEILPALRAVEALDLLIANLQEHDGTPFPLSHHPAMTAVGRMGVLALPKLITALRESPDADQRRHVVFCLTWIGGPSARRALSKSLPRETNKCTKFFIESSLRALSNKQKPNHIVEPDRLKWYGSFLCRGV